MVGRAGSERLGWSLILDHEGDAEALREIVETQLETMTPEERFDFNKALKVVGTTTQQALPGVVGGATTGMAAGPWGAVAGGLIGGAASVASHHTGKRGAKAPKPSGKPASRATAVAPGTNPAAAQLLALLQDPRMVQAAAALMMSAAGTKRIAAGSTTAPPGAFLNLLAVLAQQAATPSAPAASERMDEYLRDDQGAYTCDVASRTERAQALWRHLATEGSPAADAAPDTDEESDTEDPVSWLVATGAARPI